jgi:hypothetical protein
MVIWIEFDFVHIFGDNRRDTLMAYLSLLIMYVHMWVFYL